MRAAVTTILALLVLAGCGGGSSGSKPKGPQPQLDPPQAAEPVAGPPVKGTPPGRVVKVGAKPEGVAVDPRTHLAAVAVQSPAALVLVDTRSGRVVRRVRLPGTARHVALMAPGGPFLAPAETANKLVEVSTDGHTRTTAVGDHPHDATSVGDRIFTADEFGSTLTVVRDGRVRGTVAVDVQPGGVAAVDGKVASVSVRAYTVELYPGDRDEPRGEGAQSAGLGPSHVVTGPDGRLAIADTRGQALVVYDTRPRLRFRARVALGGTPVGIAADPGRGVVWAALSERNRVVPVDLRPKKPTIGKPVKTARDPFSVGVDTATGRLAIASRSDGTLQLVDP